MPLGGQGRHVIFHYGPGTSAAFRGEHVEVIFPAVRPAFPLVETFFAELFAALRAEKVFRVPCLVQGRHAFLKGKKNETKLYRKKKRRIRSRRRILPDSYVQYGSVAVGASRREQIVVVRFAVRPAFAFEEIPGAQLLGTVVAREVLRVPRLAQGRDDLADDGLVARGATAFLRRVHALSVHLGGQAAEHTIQWCCRVYRFGSVTCLHRTGHLRKTD